MPFRAAVGGALRKQGNWWLTKWVVRPYFALGIRAVRLIRRPIVVGITGSVGKTTTTATIAAMLGHPAARQVVGRVGYTKNNMNSHWGVPLTIMGQDSYLPDALPARLAAVAAAPWRALLSRDYPRVLILELGTSRKGMLDQLGRLARPDIGIVTTVGPSHLERLKTTRGVAEEKSAVVRWTSPRGLVILGDGHDHIDLLRSRARAPVMMVGGRGVELSRNIARVVGRRLGLRDAVIEEALAGVEPPKGRLHRIDAGRLTIIDDSYNANPLSVKLGLDTLAEASAGRRVAVLGTMAELGDESGRHHREVGEYARPRCDLLIGVGEAARGYAPDRWFATSAECARGIEELVRPGDWVLVKGSASVGMSTVVERLREAGCPTAGAGAFDRSGRRPGEPRAPLDTNSA